LVRDGARVLILSSGMVGHETNCLGVAEALGAPYKTVVVAPRRLFRGLSPYGPIDPKDRPDRPGSILSPPFPDIVIACGRVTVPYIRALKRAGGRKLFAAFLQDPRHARSEFDLIWTPLHDRLSGPNVIATLTSPHPFTTARLTALRETPDPRIAALPAPRASVLLGGPSGAHAFPPGDLERMARAVAAIASQGHSVMATPSRRTPPALIEAVRTGLAGADPTRVFLWDGAGDNPYGHMLAHADAILVTGDSVNMIGEAVSTGAPVFIFAPSGGGGRIGDFIAALEQAGAVRRFDGRLSRFAYEPIDSSAAIAKAIAGRFEAMDHR
jgi:mitochondrial fission protein ELM1